MQPSLTTAAIDGLSFETARLNVLDKLKTAIDKSQGHPLPYSIDHFFVLYLVPAFVLVILIVSTVFGYGLISVAGTVFTILFLTAACALNIWIQYRCQLAVTNEVTWELQRLYDEYAHSASFSRVTFSRNFVDDSPPQGPTAELTSGHPQSSIVSCFRNRSWQRIPSLLLAEGDIISLQGGDITPGDCFEISSDQQTSTFDGTPSTPMFSPRGQKTSFLRVEIDREKLVPKGTKILIRDRKAPKSPGLKHAASQPARNRSNSENKNTVFTNMPGPPQNYSPVSRRGSFNSSNAPTASLLFPPSPREIGTPYHRHKSLPPDSLELLQLSGDTRCFQLAETPMEKFISQIVETAESRHRRSVSTASTLVALWKRVREKPQNSSLVLGTQDRMSSVSVLCMYLFCFSVMICCVLIILQCCASVIRLAILLEGRKMWVHVISFPLVSIVLSILPISLPAFMLFIDALSIANLLALTEVVAAGDIEEDVHEKKHMNKKDHTKMEISSNAFDFQHAGLGSTPFNPLNEDETDFDVKSKPRGLSVGQSSKDDDFSSDEFLDEDIDVRVGEMDRETSTRVHYGRRAAYMVAGLCRRLGLTDVIGSSSLYSSEKMLPIPFASKRLLEYLGAVTMVCFVDDDVICEGVSATEEVFLLKSETENENGGQVTERAAGDTELVGSKGITIDLTSSTTAGARFETSNWWKYLPNLKPIGLNSMLTYKPMPPLPAGQDFVSYSVSSRDVRDKVTSVEGSVLSNAPHGSLTTVRKNSAQSTPSHADMFVSLVSHVRKTIPLESLRQLSLDIGFVDDDLAYFQKLLELNVIAPGLGDARLLEDMHAMGQEEVRRRGMLLTNLRSAVVMDSRSNALQMMSEGDPALLLHYCAEYWDGASISPLSDTDRKEILAVYERWVLEDFDVTAFAYTPIPTYLQPAVLQAHALAQYVPPVPEQVEPGGLMISSASSAGVGMAQRRQQRRKQSNCIFIVDPLTATSAASPRPFIPLNKKSNAATPQDDIEVALDGGPPRPDSRCDDIAGILATPNVCS
jgi:hypothetical protein